MSNKMHIDQEGLAFFKFVFSEMTSMLVEN